jgi:hypothetical protein
MKHKASRDLYAYWNSLRGENPAPERSQIDPGAIRSALGDTIILSQERGQDANFRLAGTRVCALFCRELKNTAFEPLLDDRSRADMAALVRQANADFSGFVAGLTANVADTPAIPVELLLLPIFQRGTGDGRLIGVLAPVLPPASMPYWLGVKPVLSLTLNSWRHVSPQLETITVPKYFEVPDMGATPRSAATAPAARQRAFVVFPGGRA